MATLFECARLTSVPDGRSLNFSTSSNGMISAEIESVNLLTMLMANYEE
jgi:hypothetical protein